MITLAQLREKIVQKKKEKGELIEPMPTSEFDLRSEVMDLSHPPEFWPQLQIINRLCYPRDNQPEPNSEEVGSELDRLHAIIKLKELLMAIFQTKVESVKEIYALLEEILEEFNRQEASDPDNQLVLPLEMMPSSEEEAVDNMSKALKEVVSSVQADLSAKEEP